MVDLDTAVIVQIGAAPADVRDSVDLPQRVEEAKDNLAQLGLKPEALTADRGHHSEENLVEVEAQGVTPIIRTPTPAGKPGFRPQDFAYVPEADEYRCPAGQSLRRKGWGNDGKARYQARASGCRRCEQFGMCTKSRHGRVIDRALHQGELERNRERVRSPGGRELLSRHRHCAEAPWSYAKLHGGLARVNTRGLANAAKKALIQGIGWNLMKLIAHLTGLRPRGKRAAGNTCVGSRPLMTNIHGLIHHFRAVIGFRFRMWLRRCHRVQSRNVSRKRLLSRAC